MMKRVSDDLPLNKAEEGENSLGALSSFGEALLGEI